LGKLRANSPKFYKTGFKSTFAKKPHKFLGDTNITRAKNPLRRLKTQLNFALQKLGGFPPTFFGEAPTTKFLWKNGI